MKYLPLLITLLVSMLASGSLMAQAEKFRHDPQALFDACGSLCDLVAPADSGSKAMVSQQVQPRAARFVMLRGPGSIISGTSAELYLDVFGDFPFPVFVAGRVFQTSSNGRVAVERAFYAARNISVTRFGAGYFPALYAGGVIPLGEVAVGNAGEVATVQAVVFDALNGGPIQTVTATLWSRVRPVPAKPSRVHVTSAEVHADGETLRLNGRFPVGERLLFGVGDQEWDAGFQEVQVRQDQANQLFVRIPPGKNGNRLYPGMWQAEAVWGLTILTQDGETFSFPGLLRVSGLPDGRVANAN